MKLITKEIEKKIAKYPLYSQDGKGDDAVVICKFFGLVVGPYGAALGYFTLSELEGVKFPPFGLGVERDLYFNGTMKDAKEDARVA